MKNRVMGFGEIAIARDTLQLPPRLAARMPIGAEVAASGPAVVGAIRRWTEVSVRVDTPPATSGEADERRWRAGCLGTSIGALLTRLAERFVDQPRKRFGCCGAGSSGRIRLAGSVRCGPGVVEPPDMDDKADAHESDQ